MPSSDYTSAVGGGLKLKGGGGGGIEKKKRSKKKKPASDAESTEPKLQPGSKSSAAATSPEDDDTKPNQINEISRTKVLGDETPDVADGARAVQANTSNVEFGKTEAERRYEERRRRRLDDRLRREGVLTHKERVERLNKYLSGLSEHHDMPRIGPG